MNFGMLLEKITEKGFPEGYFYAHIPSLGLTTHGLGVDGARQAAFDLARVWLAEKKPQGDPLPAPSEILFSTLEIPDHLRRTAHAQITDTHATRTQVSNASFSRRTTGAKVVSELYQRTGPAPDRQHKERSCKKGPGSSS
jgi:hypothetical protein